MKATVKRCTSLFKDPLVVASVFFIKLYRALWSSWAPKCCRFEPSCSEYALEAFRMHSWLRAVCLIMYRLIRCHPFSKGGLDLVPTKENRL